MSLQDGVEDSASTLDQPTFFRSVGSGNLTAVSGLLKNRKIDVNAVNDEGVTALVLAVYHYEERRRTDMVEALLSAGADPTFVCRPVGGSDRRIAIVRPPAQNPQQDAVGSQVPGGSPSGGRSTVVGLGNSGSSLAPEQWSTRRIPIAGKTPLLLALELKSALYLKGWDYRHWDALLGMLAKATAERLEEQLKGASTEADESNALLLPPPLPNTVPPEVAAAWAAVFESGRHETVEVWSEGKPIEVLCLLLSGSSKVLRAMVDTAAKMGSRRVELRDVSHTLARAMLGFLYCGSLDPAFVRVRGCDLLVAARRYELDALKEVCVSALEANPDNWIRLLTVALEVGEPRLALKCALSISTTMGLRRERTRQLDKPVFAAGFVPPSNAAVLDVEEQ